MKPRLSMVMGSWCCLSIWASQRICAFGKTPAEAYEKWLEQGVRVATNRAKAAKCA